VRNKCDQLSGRSVLVDAPNSTWHNCIGVAGEYFKFMNQTYVMVKFNDQVGGMASFRPHQLKKAKRNPSMPKVGGFAWRIALYLPRKIRLACAMQYELAKQELERDEK